MRVAGEPVGMRLEDVRQVLERGAAAPAPGTHPAMLGVTRVGTLLVPLVDLAVLLGWHGAARTPRDTAVLAECGGRPVVFQVDAADAVVREAPLPVPGGWRLPWASGVARSGGDLIPIVDMVVLAERLTSVEVGERA